MGGKLDFTLFSAQRGGKLEIAALPLLSSAVKSILQLSSAPTGRKLEIAALPLLSSAIKSFSSFPPLREEESWKLQLYRCSHRR
ncbi:hypothetical protein MRB53_021515 [Persea americana]|uniref:Uncharacterized protein n=1 Tax=Persea americana TaxID=3435 RepID=A0ACC2L4K8_PERAE|nr:hypothetical protein MRB53_021515 [Persea americana]